MSMCQSSLYIAIELDMAEAQVKTASDKEAPHKSEDFEYCFGRIIGAKRGATDDHHAEAESSDSVKHC